MSTPRPIRFQDAAEDQAKRIRTRARLMDCAIVEFAGNGIAQTSVDDIVSKAGVSHGTFYYHFKNKTEIVESVGRAVAAGFVTIVDQEIRHVTDGPQRVALATQVFIDMASAIPNWGWLVVDALSNMGTFHKYISRGIRKDVLIGIRSGDFVAEPSELLFNSLLAVVATAVRARLEHPTDTAIAPKAAELVLLMLGTPAGKSRALPLSVLKLTSGAETSPPAEIEDRLESIMPQLLEEFLGDREDQPATLGQ